ncbi:hypothetical protein HELRODRAFT_65386, partial [Helobdella robusta]|uniref:carbonic anhydrase n=1 Tax=Helobdella robusta TaxID=6412 RepID=T1FY70_HELRO
DGPKNWYQLSSDFSLCAGLKQSPIDLKTLESQYNRNIGDFVFSSAYRNSLNDVSELELLNNGHTFNLDIKYNPGVAIANQPTMNGGGLPGTYLLAGVHGQWGSDDSRGSEHTFKSRQYPLELHLIHYNTKYKSLNEAMAHADGLAVLAVLCQVFSSTIGEILRLVGSVKESGRSVQVKIKPFLLLPQEKGSFFRYPGSLTTPPCSEIVNWTVFRNFAEVKRNEVSTFCCYYHFLNNSIHSN